MVAQPGSNQIEIADEVYKRLEEIKKDMPPDIILGVGYDRTQFVRKAVSEVKETLAIAIGLVVLIIFLFFREWTIAFRPLIDIPVSLIGAFFIMYVAGFSINVLTLLAIVLATGLVVDDGIVVTENIFKKMEHGMNKRKAALEGSKEIYFAVIATSLTFGDRFSADHFPAGFCWQVISRIRDGFGRRRFDLCIRFLIANACTEHIFLQRKILQNIHGSIVKQSLSFPGWKMVIASIAGFYEGRWVAFVIVLPVQASFILLEESIPSELAPIGRSKPCAYIDHLARGN